VKLLSICYLGEQIKQTLGNGERYGVDIVYSEEAQALETGGGIFKALPLLGSEPFIVVSSDIITDYPLANLPKDPKGLAHLILIDNPSITLQVIFVYRIRIYITVTILRTPSQTSASTVPNYLFLANQAVSAYTMYYNLKILQQNVTGEYYQGRWYNVRYPGRVKGS